MKRILIPRVMRPAPADGPQQRRNRRQPPPTEHQSLDCPRLAFAQATPRQPPQRGGTGAGARRRRPGFAIVDTVQPRALPDLPRSIRRGIDPGRAGGSGTRTPGLPGDPELQLLAGTIHYRAGEPVAQEILDGLLRHSDPTGTTRARRILSLASSPPTIPAGTVARTYPCPCRATPTANAQADRMELEGRLAGIEGDIDRALGRQTGPVVILRGTERDYAAWCAR